MLERVKGVVPPAVTPLTADGDLDEAGLERLIERFVSAGVDGLFMMGTTGETYVLPDAVRAGAVTAAARVLAGRLPLYVGVGDNAPDRTLRNAEQAAQAGADVLVLISPPYLAYSEAERVRYMREMAGRMPLPVLLYNIPQVNRNPVTVDVLRELLGAPNIVGMKDSESDGPKNAEVLNLLRAHPDFRWFEGNDSLAASSLLMGAHGIVNGGSNVFPHLYVRLYRAAQGGDVAAVREAQSYLMRAQALFELDRDSTWFGSFLKTTKYALQVLGVCGEYVSYPFQPLGAEARQAVEQLLAELSE